MAHASRQGPAPVVRSGHRSDRASRRLRLGGGIQPRVQARSRTGAKRLATRLLSYPRRDLAGGGVSIGLDDQPGASVLLDVVTEDLVLAFVCVEVERVAGVGDLCRAVASTGRAEEV